ncbi:uncharacterized protein [Watersipora subatra]|uniref:uncharacterized protein n=1 Tax=Watersipora subatra TaxID=2589382 RepID=UPI00355B1F35
MPEGDGNQFDWRAGLQLSLLLLALPAQYLIVNYSSVSQHQSQKALKDLLSQVRRIGTDLFSLSVWQQWWIDLVTHHKNKNGYKIWKPGQVIYKEDITGESPALEVMQYEDPSGYFANSALVRSPRPKTALYRVGQVITHKKYGYRGVIVGWDPHAKAPEKWLAVNHPTDSKVAQVYPNYAVLVDVRDRPEAQLTYVAQDNIKLATNTRIIHPDRDRYFDEYDGTKYLARPALVELYPDD